VEEGEATRSVASINVESLLLQSYSKELLLFDVKPTDIHDEPAKPESAMTIFEALYLRTYESYVRIQFEIVSSNSQPLLSISLEMVAM